MAEPQGDDHYQSGWIRHMVAARFDGHDPDRQDIVVELCIDGDTVTLESSNGIVSLTPGHDKRTCRHDLGSPRTRCRVAARPNRQDHRNRQRRDNKRADPSPRTTPAARTIRISQPTARTGSARRTAHESNAFQVADGQQRKRLDQAARRPHDRISSIRCVDLTGPWRLRSTLLSVSPVRAIGRASPCRSGFGGRLCRFDDYVSRLAWRRRCGGCTRVGGRG